MKNNKTRYAVNKQEDEDVETIILHPENAIADIKQVKPQQVIAGSAESIKRRVFNKSNMSR